MTGAPFYFSIVVGPNWTVRSFIQRCAMTRYVPHLGRAKSSFKYVGILGLVVEPLCVRVPYRRVLSCETPFMALCVCDFGDALPRSDKGLVRPFSLRCSSFLHTFFYPIICFYFLPKIRINSCVVCSLSPLSVLHEEPVGLFFL
ncbi:hypothetical protein, unlikely [Trypanosoma brucei gambiense DAL972]|uniref:Uncharacterized protein n=1 Tax=Trypanosoma brucei gambiense (strain MHOM/CI/86/DAL972) TaxID=679716 RepID=C9ZNH2_TRYB9|nr:hypothetical protein, unlikely [Trypanosoma brucei gambiense DAL972]CBH10950.1 hypothetical protein, unlikely [Trypanosoma brucei gambiense DAL972]|eukprot:XP_011773237.1 hypothetical protein, unlikely [Trypanosoma brucei gambiense DAL972]